MIKQRLSKLLLPIALLTGQQLMAMPEVADNGPGVQNVAFIIQIPRAPRPDGQEPAVPQAIYELAQPAQNGERPLDLEVFIPYRRHPKTIAACLGLTALFGALTAGKACFAFSVAATLNCLGFVRVALFPRQPD